MKNFKDKVAVITGAASGIGRGISNSAVKEGMKRKNLCFELKRN
jgi:NADP-dependent 3-hydroxy acid dehydrogenase YdfG